MWGIEIISKRKEFNKVEKLKITIICILFVLLIATGFLALPSFFDSMPLVFQVGVICFDIAALGTMYYIIKYKL